MPLPPAPQPRRKTNKDLLFKGILCSLIGLGVLLAPQFIKTADMQTIVGGASLVGWFALVLGLALTARYFWQRR